MRTPENKQTNNAPKKVKPNPWAKMEVVRGASIYEDVDASTLTSAIASASKNGDALLFGCTSDGGAASVTWLRGKERIKIYPASVSELEDALEALTLYYA